jgi:L-rhamnonate dehydratase
MVPHGSGPYSYYFCCTRQNSPFNEIIMSAPKADKVLPAFNRLLLDESNPGFALFKAAARIRRRSIDVSSQGGDNVYA